MGLSGNKMGNGKSRLDGELGYKSTGENRGSSYGLEFAENRLDMAKARGEH